MSSGRRGCTVALAFTLCACSFRANTAAGDGPHASSDGIGGSADARHGVGDAGMDAIAVPDGLVAYYPMDSLSSGTVVDATGNGHDGACTTCPTVTGGVIGGAYAFTGADPDVIDVVAPTGNALNTMTAFTVAFWVRFTTLPTDTGNEATEYGCPVNKPWGATDSDSWQLCYAGTNAEWFYGTQESGSFGVVQSAGSGIVAGTWYHAAITWDGTTKQLWIDGSSIGSDAASGIEFDGNSLTIGADTLDGSSSAVFDGLLDDVRIYDRALDPSEIQTLAQQ